MRQQVPFLRAAARSRLVILALAAILGVSLMASPARAVQPDEILKDPVLEARARKLSDELRCLVCQNQTIDDSNAAIARDLRILLRERLLAGDTDQQVLDFMVARYGNFVLLKPPMQFSTLLLWTGPTLFLLAAGWGASRYLRRASSPAATLQAPLTDEEEQRISALLASKESE